IEIPHVAQVLQGAFDIPDDPGDVGIRGKAHKFPQGVFLVRIVQFCRGIFQLLQVEDILKPEQQQPEQQLRVFAVLTGGHRFKDGHQFLGAVD
ncbi:MAG: hypothetical protein KDG51_19050, partial [Calditrichaeota bacterium]|nr:hypothetical protein [Calditrichota bacterium]